MFHSSRLGASVASICLGCLIFANSAAAQSVVIQLGKYSWVPGGGEFNAIPTAFFPKEPVRLTNDADGHFETFCLEAQKPIPLGQSADVGFPGLVNNSGYTLNEETAWLYDQFIRGVLVNYDYENDDFNPFDPGNPGLRLTDAGALAFAIWELADNPVQDTGPPNMFNPSPAKTAAWKALAIAAAQNSGNYFGVELLEITQPTLRGELTYFQSVLFKNLPSPGTATLLGLGGLIAARRRRSSGF